MDAYGARCREMARCLRFDELGECGGGLTLQEPSVVHYCGFEDVEMMV